MIYSKAGIEQAQSDLKDRLVSELCEGKSVLWLISGGPNTKPTVAILNSLPDGLPGQLCIMLVHEYYGEPGDHKGHFGLFEYLLACNASSYNKRFLTIHLSGHCRSRR